MNMNIPEILEEIPEEYMRPAIHQGRVVKFTYKTRDAFNYKKNSDLNDKTALVYLPFGYDENTKYNIFYLMHGGGGNERTYLGSHRPFPKDRFKSYGFKNIIDHAIEDGRIEPLIIVCPTYNNDSDRDSWSYEKAIRLTSLYPRQELIKDLVPAVESSFSTYTGSTDPAGLRDSRTHRGFGGFSMGSVTTWQVFDQCLDYFSFFIMMSGNCGDGSQQDAAVKQSGLGMDDFFIFTATGTEDFAYPAFRQQVMNMGHYYTDSFRFTDNTEDGCLVYREKEGAVHDYKYANQYIYNGLQYFRS